MKMKNDRIYKAILNKAFEQTVNSFSANIEINDGDEKLSLGFEDYFEDTMENTRLVGENSEEKSTACAAAFALHSINMVAQTYEIQGKIDDFFASSDNQDWLKENGIADDEKAALCQELKDFVSEELAVKGKTKEENAFVEKVKAVFENDKAENSVDKLKTTLNFISDVNKRIQNNSNAQDALNSAYNDLSFLDGEHKITDVIFESIPTLANSIGKESTDEYMQEISANYIEDTKVNSQSFGEHFDESPKNLTPEEKDWAHKTFCKMLFNALDSEKGFDFENINYTSFLANGEQIISNEEFENSKGDNGFLTPEKIQEMEEKIAAKMVSGEKITVRKYPPEKSVVVNPADIKLKNAEAMSHIIFDSHYKSNPNRLTDYDIQWANEAFDALFMNALDAKNKWTVINVDLSSFCANGKPIITSEEYEKAKDANGEIAPDKESEMKFKIAARLAAGDKISVRRSVPEKSIEPDVIFNKTKEKSEMTQNVSKERSSESVKQAADKSVPVNGANQKNTSTKENSNVNDTSDKAKESDSEKKESKKTPRTFKDFMYMLFVKLFDALDKSLEASREKKSKATEKSSRTKTSFSEIMSKEPRSKKITINVKKTLEKSFGEKSATNKGKSM